ncbi:metal-dependent hydrolase [Spartobacteria bacterium LR76]|nr:metal-dependent hydrolase [Spartobacteria bacterium LR76]
MKLSYYGHSCFAVETSGTKLLFDPFIRPNGLAASVDVSSITADYILLSHGHFDHVADAVELAKQTGATVISNFEIYTWLGQQGIEKTHPMNHGGSFLFPFGRVKFVNAIHSSVLPDGTYGGNPGGYVIESPEGVFYYAGDTALTLDMQLIAEEFDLSFAVLPIGDNFTMGANDAGRASKLLGCKTVVGVHYDTFPPIKIDHEKAKATVASHGATLHLPEIGQTIDL